MIFLIIGNTGVLLADAASFTGPEFFARPAVLTADTSRYVAWMEVYPTIEVLFEAVVTTALQDRVCREMLNTMEQELGLALLQPSFLAVSERQRQRVAMLFWRVLHPWCDPRVGNPQTPAPPSQRLDVRLAGWVDRFHLLPASVQAIEQYVALDSQRPHGRAAPRAQVRAFFNIVDLTRAVLGEVVTHPVRRVDKVLALRLCRSPRLHARQQALLKDYLDRHRDLILDAAEAGHININDTQYLKYYLGKYAQSVGKKVPLQVRQLLSGFFDIALGREADEDVELEPAYEIWRRLPPIVQGTVLFNDLRKLFEKAQRSASATSDTSGYSRWEGDGDLEGGQSYQRACLVLPDLFERNEGGGLWPIHYRAEDPSGDAPPYPPNTVPFLRAWNPDEYAPYAMAYRVNLCPLWAGPSGHTVNAIRHWIYALGGEDCPRDVGEVVATSLFLFWRLYYDKRISAAHTLTEAFESTLVTAAGSAAIANGVDIQPAPNTKALLSDSDDAFDLVTSCRLRLTHNLWANHPIGVLRQAFRGLWRGAGFAGYDACNVAIEGEQAALTELHYSVPDWSRDDSKATGVDVENYAPPEDTDLRPDPAALLELVVDLFVPVLARLADTDSVMVGPRAPWSHHRALMAGVRGWTDERQRRGDIRRGAVLGELTTISTQLTQLAGDSSWGLLCNGELRAHLPDRFDERVAEVQRRLAICSEAFARTSKVGPVNIAALPQESLLFLENPFRSVRVALYRASTTTRNNRASANLLRYFQALKGAWYRLVTLTDVERVARPASMVLPQPLDPDMAKLLGTCTGFISRLRRVFDPLIADTQSKIYKPVLGSVTCSELRRLNRELTQDSAFFESVAKERFFDVDVSIHIGLKLCQFAQFTPSMVQKILAGVAVNHDEVHLWDKTVKQTLRSYRSRTEPLLDLARELAAQARGMGEQVPKERIKSKALQMMDASGRKATSVSPITMRRTTFAESSSRPRISGPKRGPGLDDHWYTCDEIELVTRLRLDDLAHRVYFMVGIDSTLHAGFTIEDNIREAVVAILGTTVDHIILPVHVGGNHWTALHLQFYLGYELAHLCPTIQYADPMGPENIPGNVRRALDDIFPGGTIQPTSINVYQPVNDGYNCGPWTAFLLEYMVRNDGALPPTNEIEIGARRADDQRRIHK